MKDQFREFEKQFRSKIVMQWYEAYVNFIECKKSLQEMKEIYDDHHQQFFLRGNEYTHLLELTSQNRKQFILSVSYCEQLIKAGQDKFQAFFIFKKNDIIYFCQQLENVMHELSRTEIITHQSCMQRYYLKSAIKNLYAKCHYLNSFIALNLETVAIIKKKLGQYKRIVDDDGVPINTSEITELSQENQQQAINTRKLRKNSSRSFSSIEQLPENIKEQSNFLLKIQQNIKELYLQLVFHNQDKIHKLDQLVEQQNKRNSNKTYILVGLFSGMSIVSFLAVFLLLIFGIVTPSYEKTDINSMLYVFPMFRGVWLFIMYLWGFAWNVFGFTKYRISFRKILQFGAHYSTYMIIIKRASFFSLIFCLMLLIYFLGETYNQNHRDAYQIPVEYAPFIVWILYMGYIFFPNRDVFNPQGRKYFYKVIKNVILSPCGKMSFLISWLTDQTVSFVIPLKDMAYTICFYTSDFSNNNIQGVKSCLDKTTTAGFFVTYLIALFPLLFRMIQCYRQAVQDKGKFIGHLQMWNFGKYTASVITATFGYLSTIFENLLVGFVVSSIVSTTYAYYWDLKYDWGFLQKSSKHQFLRNHLSYRKPYFYYVAIFLNLIFRLSWTLSISTFILKALPSQVLPLILGIIEILRRCMWNFFRIEKQHIINCRNYSVTQNIEKSIQKIRQFNQQTAKEENQNLVNSAILTQSIPYFYRNSMVNFLDMKLVPQTCQQITIEQIGVLTDKFKLALQKQRKIISVGKNKLHLLK